MVERLLLDALVLATEGGLVLAVGAAVLGAVADFIAALVVAEEDY